VWVYKKARAINTGKKSKKVRRCGSVNNQQQNHPTSLIARYENVSTMKGENVEKR